MKSSAAVKPDKDAVTRTREFLDAIPFNSLLGIQISRGHADGVTLYCKVKKELLNSNKVLHGGVAASIADAAVDILYHRGHNAFYKHP